VLGIAAGLLSGCSGDDAMQGSEAGAGSSGSGAGTASAGDRATTAGTGAANDGAGSGGRAGMGAGQGGGGTGDAGRAGTGVSGASGAGGAGTGASDAGPARAFAQKLGRDHFLIGMGNDLADDHDEDGAYTLGVTLDLHYAFMVGLLGMGGWPDWNENGSFVNILADAAERHGTVPMFTLYSMAAWGEANVAVLTNDDYMEPYWDGARLLFERIAIFGQPTLVQFEPDFWAFMQQQASGDPHGVDVHVSALVPECADQPDDLVGLGRCLVTLGRMHAPKALLGFHASVWANPDPAAIAEYLNEIGADQSDYVTIDMLDRDAGCFEAHVDDACQRNDGPWYWDEENQSSPNFHEHFAWARQIADGTGKPILWWQVPFGVPSDTPGGTAGHYRDNRVKYIFEHVQELIDAGGVGAAFGVGAGNQTYITTDGDQFKNAVTKYYADPAEL